MLFIDNFLSKNNFGVFELTCGKSDLIISQVKNKLNCIMGFMFELGVKKLFIYWNIV